MVTSGTPTERVDVAWESLIGLSVGDALGAQYFVPGTSTAALLAGELPPAPWPWTDDTEMALTVFAELRDHQDIDPDRLATTFADRCEPYRGYGPGAVTILHAIRDGVPWAEAARSAFDGTGSCGNGAAMRVPPLGAFRAGDPEAAARDAATSAQVTHAHPEGVAGAVAVAVAACLAAASRSAAAPPAPADFLSAVAGSTPPGSTRDGILLAATVTGARIAEAAHLLGNGSRSTAQDSVPLALWAAARDLGHYPAAVVTCIVAGGDVDTTAAMAGGVVAARTGIHGSGPGTGVPQAWIAAREPLPGWI